MGSRTGSCSSKGKERLCVAEADGADSIRKAGGEEKRDGDWTNGTAEDFSAFGKMARGKGNGGVGLSEGDATQAHLDWALKERVTFCGPRIYWEEEQSNKGMERTYCDDPSSPQWDGPIGVACRPKTGLKEGQPTAEASWASFPFRPTKDRPLKEAMASFCRSRSKRWFEEELLAGGMSFAAEKREKGRVSLANTWLLEAFPL